MGCMLACACAHCMRCMCAGALACAGVRGVPCAVCGAVHRVRARGCLVQLVLGRGILHTSWGRACEEPRHTANGGSTPCLLRTLAASSRNGQTLGRPECRRNLLRSRRNMPSVSAQCAGIMLMSMWPDKATVSLVVVPIHMKAVIPGLGRVVVKLPASRPRKNAKMRGCWEP